MVKVWVLLELLHSVDCYCHQKFFDYLAVVFQAMCARLSYGIG